MGIVKRHIPREEWQTIVCNLLFFFLLVFHINLQSSFCYVLWCFIINLMHILEKFIPLISTHHQLSLQYRFEIGNAPPLLLSPSLSLPLSQWIMTHSWSWLMAFPGSLNVGSDMMLCSQALILQWACRLGFLGRNEMGFLSVFLTLALVEGCSLRSSCFRFSEERPIGKIFQQQGWEERTGRREAVSGKHCGDRASGVWILKICF